MSLDIELFYVQIRSILDYAAVCIGEAPDRPKNVPRGMHDLTQFIRQPGNRARLGTDLVDVIEALAYLPDIRDARDAAAHRGALTLVYGEPADGLWFQVNARNFFPIVKPPDEASRGNLVNFRLYGSFLMADTLVFLDRVAATLEKRLHVSSIGKARVGPGLDVLIAWLAAWDTETA